MKLRLAYGSAPRPRFRRGVWCSATLFFASGVVWRVRLRSYMAPMFVWYRGCEL